MDGSGIGIVEVVATTNMPAHQRRTSVLIFWRLPPGVCFITTTSNSRPLLTDCGSQGDIRIFSLLFQTIGEQWIDYLESPNKKIEFVEYLQTIVVPSAGTNSESLADLIWHHTVEIYSADQVARDNFVRQAILNRADEADEKQ